MEIMSDSLDIVTSEMMDEVEEATEDHSDHEGHDHE